MDKSSQLPSRRFLTYLLERLGSNPKVKDSGLVARMKRADNPDMDYQVWDTLLFFHVDIENSRQRLPFCLVGAALCRHDSEQDGSAGLGEALRSCYTDETADSGTMRLRRLLNCSTTAEVCQVLRPILSLIESKASKPLDHHRLLEELLSFEGPRQESIKIRWARQFWYLPQENNNEDNA